VQYALDLGLPPHPDYRVAKLIFGSIPAEACTSRFVFGENGKPTFVAGPYDDPARCQQVLRALKERCGPDGYHFMVPADVLGIASEE
jgi:hypothetical protein